MDFPEKPAVKETVRANLKLSAVVVTFHPGPELEENLSAVVRECGHAIVVDNGSSEIAHQRVLSVPGVELIKLGKNLGIAAALNRGLEQAASLGCEWVITFDQDSQPLPGFSENLLRSAERLARKNKKVGMVGPRIGDPGKKSDGVWLTKRPRFPFFYRCIKCGEDDLGAVSMLITSGALTSVAAWRDVGGFDESLFIDYVDTDLCLRLLHKRYTLAVSAKAHLSHRLGAREDRKLLGKTFHPTHHAPLRHYYITRNRIPMLKRHMFRVPHWFWFECSTILLWLFRVMTFEQHRRKKLKAMLLGTWDGLMGRSGVCPEKRAAALR